MRIAGAIDGRWRGALLVMVTALAATGCGGSGSDADGSGSGQEDGQEQSSTTVDEQDVEDGDVEETELPLEEVDDSGVTGTVRIGPTEGDALSIEVTLDEGEGTHGVAARIGSCDDAIDPGAADSLVEGATSYTLADVEDGSMQDEATLPEELISEGTYALVVYDGSDVEGDVAACAEVEVE